MTLQTAPPTTRQLANRLRSTLEWIDSHADDLPTGWIVDSRNGAIEWSAVYGDSRAALDGLVALLGAPTVSDGRGDLTWHDWDAEGDRPRLTVFIKAVQS